jgi:tetratricopeptide (TPR) repeat protein
VTLAALALWISLLSFSTPAADDFRAAFDRGLAAMAAERFEDAQAAFEEARKLRPGNALVHFHLAQIHEHRREIEPAIANLRRAIAINPREPRFYFRLALLQTQLQRFHDAEQAVQDLLRVRPGYAPAYLLLGRIAQHQGDHATAERHLRRYRRLRPADLEGMWQLGATLSMLEKYQEGAALLQRALRKDPKLGPAHYNLGVLYSRQGNDGLARQHLEQAAQLMPDNAQAHYQLGSVLVRALDDRSEDLQGAERSFRRALEISPGYVEAHFALGTLLRRTGREEEAARSMAEYERLSAANLEDRERTRRLSSFHLEIKSLLEQERVEEAETRLRELLALDPQNDLAYYRLGQIAFLRQDWGSALEKAREAITRKSFDPAYHLLEGMTLERLGRDEEAAAAYERVLGLAEYADAYLALGKLELRLGRRKQALAHLRRAVALEPKDPEIRQALAAAEAATGGAPR